jgi:hypothetical protein
MEAASAKITSAAIAGICTLLMVFPTTIADTLVYFGVLSPTTGLLTSAVYTALTLAGLGSFTAFTNGLVVIANKFEVKYLAEATYVVIIVFMLGILFIISAVVNVVFGHWFISNQWFISAGNLLTVAQASSTMLSGMLILKLRRHLGGIAIAVGTVEVAWSLDALLSIIGSTTDLTYDYLWILFLILGSIMFFRAARR